MLRAYFWLFTLGSLLAKLARTYMVLEIEYGLTRAPKFLFWNSLL